MEIWIIWLIAGIVLAGIEILTQMVWTICLSIGCTAALAADICGLSPAWQIAIAGIAAVVAYIALMPWLNRWQRRGRRAARTGMDALLGREGTVTDEIHPGDMGRVRIDGDYWQAVAPGAGHTLPRGSKVSVEAYDSIILTVKPL